LLGIAVSLALVYVLGPLIIAPILRNRLEKMVSNTSTPT